MPWQDRRTWVDMYITHKQAKTKDWIYVSRLGNGKTKHLNTFAYIYMVMPWFKQPILLNYTGKTCHFDVRAIPAMNPYKTKKRETMVYPPLGYAHVEYVRNEDWEDSGSAVRTTSIQVVGLPLPMKDTLCIVSTEVATILSVDRHDLVMPDNVTLETEKEIYFSGLRKFYVTR